MSMTCTVPASTTDDQYFQGVWARTFGQFIRSGREKAGLAVEPAAWLAGMCTEEWASIEAGDLLPSSRDEFRLIAAALDIPWETMANIVLMCSQAWGIR
jgi:hypothetical protein